MIRCKVALIYPYFLTPGTEHILFPPLGIAGLASQLARRGVEGRIVDCTFLSFPEAVQAVEVEAPQIIGIYLMASMAQSGLALLAELRQRLPGTLFLAGGPLASVYPEKYLASFDLVFVGEADLVFPEFCRDYLAGEVTLAQIQAGLVPAGRFYPGLAFLQAGQLHQTPPRHLASPDFDTLPLPDRRQSDHPRYQAFWQKKDGSRTASLITGYGCPHDCYFCSRPIFGRSYRRRSLDRIMEEIDEIAALGYDHLWIADDCFTLELSFVTAFCHRLLARPRGLTWSCLSRVDNLEKKVLDLMAQAGCIRVFLGLESGDDSTLQLMNKRTTTAQGEQAVRMYAQAGIKATGFFIVGYPGETMASIEKTLTWALKLPLADISINVPYPLPGSKLYQQVKMREDIDWEQENQVRFIYQSEFDPEYLAERIEKTMAEFRRKRAL